MIETWLGRRLDSKTNCWVYADGSSGSYPDEWKHEFDDLMNTTHSADQVLGLLALFKERIKLVETLTDDLKVAVRSSSDPKGLFIS